MFLDSLATPRRLETLLNLIYSFEKENYSKDDVIHLLQPDGLPELNPNRQQANDNIKAAKFLEILEEKHNLLKFKVPMNNKNVKEIIIHSFDTHILNRFEVKQKVIEPWFALFYSYILGRNEKMIKGQGGNWEVAFSNDLFRGLSQPNPFNETKYGSYLRWYGYLGLGWTDHYDVFQLNPYDRIKRSLNKIFNDEKNMEMDIFVNKLGEICPELDGGKVFLMANPGWNKVDRKLSLGVSRALFEMHLDGIIRLVGIKDHRNFWNIEKINPLLDDDLKIPQISNIMHKGNKNAN
jgi:hypothetical protein